MNVSGTLLLSPTDDAAAAEGARQTTAHSGDRAGGGSAPRGDIWRCLETSWFSQLEGTTGTWCAQTGDAAKHPAKHTAASHIKDYLAPNVSGARLRRPDGRYPNVQAQPWQVLTTGTQAQESPAREGTRSERSVRRRCSQDPREEEGGEHRWWGRAAGGSHRPNGPQQPTRPRASCPLP